MKVIRNGRLVDLKSDNARVAAAAAERAARNAFQEAAAREVHAEAMASGDMMIARITRSLCRAV